jgi:hypothetical protein
MISIIVLKARLASAPPAAMASVNTRGVICQEIPQRSLHQPQALSSPPLLMAVSKGYRKFVLEQLGRVTPSPENQCLAV